MKVSLSIRLKDDVPDNAGRAITERLQSRGFADVTAVRIGRVVEIDLEGGDRDSATNRIKQMCKQILVNEVVEEYEIVSVE